MMNWRTVGWRLGAAVTGIVLLVAMAAAPVAAATPPANDDFANATSVDSVPFSDDFNLSAATHQAGEPGSDCIPGFADLNSVWYVVKFDDTTVLQADTLRSPYAGAEVAVFRGATLNTLHRVDCNFSQGQSKQPRSVLNWRAIGGTEYFVRVSGGGGSSKAEVRLRIRAVAGAPHDSFGAAEAITLPFRIYTSNATATLQPGETQPYCVQHVGATLWYKLTPHQTMTVEADTFDSPTDTVITVYEGTALDNLDTVMCDDDSQGGQYGFQSNVSWKAKAGHTYYIQVGGWIGASGNVVFRVRQVHTLKNDNFGNARLVSYANQAQSGNTRRATAQASDPTSECTDPGSGASVWLKRVVTTPGTLVIDPDGTFPSAVVSAWEGSGPGDLTEVACVSVPSSGTDVLLVDVSPGDVVYIMVGGDGQARSGAYTLQFSQQNFQ